jgi:hypothetical protein
VSLRVGSTCTRAYEGLNGERLCRRLPFDEHYGTIGKDCPEPLRLLDGALSQRKGTGKNEDHV